MTERQIQKANERYDRLQNADKILKLSLATFIDCLSWAVSCGAIAVISYIASKI